MATAMSTRAQVAASSFISGEAIRGFKASPAAVSFGVKPCNARVSCSLEDDVRGFVKKCSDAGKAAAVALAATAIIGAAPVSAAPRLTFDEIRSQTYSEVKGTGAANQCPVLPNESADGFALAPGKYSLIKFCMEPTSFTVKAEGTFKGESAAYQKTKLMTRLTYTLDEMEGDVSVGSDGTITMTETDGIDYAAVTVQLPGGERVPFLFTVKELVATGTPDDISGTFIVPSYRGSTFLDPKGRGGSTGYDNAVALPAGGRGDEEELGKENSKNTAALEGKISFSIAKSDPSTGEVAGVFLSVQPSDTDLGAKVPKDVKIEGIWYGQLQ